MRVILIEEERFAEVCLAMFADVEHLARDYAHGFPKDMTVDQRVMLAQHIHRAAHSTFVRWAQSHGASCAKR